MLKLLFVRFFLPMALALNVGVFLVTRQFDGNLELAVLMPSVLILLSAGSAERRLAYRSDWKAGQGDLSTDITSAGLLFAFVDPLLKWLLPVLVLALVGPRVMEVGASIFPTACPSPYKSCLPPCWPSSPAIGRTACITGCPRCGGCTPCTTVASACIG
ncbi:hypothetical protein [Duganella sp. CF458]|uniref:hypothetical protein n=1 Tax=Duganella sp. CF458 TaxID=1884368 RepID=UPI001E3D0363|nr:hypothetical protein [Duganella sp. CF458]